MGGAVGRKLKKLGIVLREDPGRERADVEHAEDVSVHEQRNAEERLDALLAQDRVEDVGMVDVVDDDGAPLRRDPACEALSHRDADALLDLLFDALGGPRDQLARAFVEEEERARIGLQGLRDAVEERREQLVEVQMRESRIGDGLNPKQALLARCRRRHELTVPIAPRD
jgi:hypothetical protein